MLLRSLGGRLLLRCVSPVSRLEDLTRLSELGELAYALPAQVALAWDERQGRYLLSTEGEVLLSSEAHDGDRAIWLVDVVTAAADALEKHLDAAADASLEDHRASLGAEADRAD